MSLAGRIALVTGAGTGIGKGVAVELARRGAHVVIHYNSSDAGAKDTQQRIDDIGGQSMIVQADVAIKHEIDRMVEQAAERFGGIDILVNNAALQINYDFFDYTEELFDKLMHINLKGYWQCMQAVTPYMKAKRSGRIINIGSVHCKRPTDFDAVYCMTKGAVKMLGRESAIELAPYGITVNTIEPGYVDVGKVRIAKQEEAGKSKPRPLGTRTRFPLGRGGKPSDVASLVCYIASGETEFLTGASIRLDGASMLV